MSSSIAFKTDAKNSAAWALVQFEALVKQIVSPRNETAVCIEQGHVRILDSRDILDDTCNSISLLAHDLRYLDHSRALCKSVLKELSRFITITTHVTHINTKG